MKILFSILICFLIISCKNDVKSSQEEKISVDKEVPAHEKNVIKTKEEFVVQSTDQQTANNIKNFLSLDYLKDDLPLLSSNDRKFQFYSIDLNADGNMEIFVRFMSPYFCGSGGCTFLLLDAYGEVITKFTVTRAPIFVESSKVNGWSVLLVKDAGVFKELTFENGSYPSNPSVLPKAPYDAPSGHAQVMFDDEFYKSKTFDF